MRSVIVIIIAMSFFTASAGVVNYELPSYFSRDQITLGAKGVGQACLTMDNIFDSLPCNPALIANERPSTFTVLGSIGNSYEALKTANQILKKDMNQELIDSLFNENQVLEGQLNTELTLIRKSLGIRFNPYQIRYFSVVRNAAYPEVGVQAMQESNITVMSGFKNSDQLNFGGQIRIINRKFVSSSFSLYDALAEDGKKYLTPQEQKAVYFDPGLSFAFNDNWGPYLSLVIKNIGYSSKEFNELPDPIQPNIGIGVKPNIGMGLLEVSFDFAPNSDPYTNIDDLKLGASYKFGHMTGLLGLNTKEFTGGIIFGINKLQAGIVFTTTQIPFQGEKDYVQTVYTQLGYQI